MRRYSVKYRCTEKEFQQKLREYKIARLLNDPMVTELELWLKTHKASKYRY